MRPERSTAPLVAGALLLGGTLLLGGCDLGDQFARRPQNSAPVSSTPTPETAAIASILDLVIALHQSDPAHQAELFQSVKDAAELTPTTSNRLRLAMALATPGHAAADPVAAQRQLSDLLAKPETLLPIERSLALAQLNEVEQRLILQTENARLREDEARESRDRQQAMSRRLQAEIDENARLRKALDDAEAKLDAVTHIERSISEQTVPVPSKK